MSSRPDNDRQKIDDVEKTLNQIIDNQLYSIPGNDISLINGTLGGRNSADGDDSGNRSSAPIPHDISEIDLSGAATGVFDNLIPNAQTIILDAVGSVISLKNIHQFIDGMIVKITPAVGKTIDFLSGGNIALPSGPFTLTDKEMCEVQYFADTNTYKCISTGTGGVGLSEPLQHSVLDFGDVSLATINLTADTKNVFRVRLTGDIGVAINSTLPILKFQMLHLVLIQDGTGGHDVTSWTGVNGTPSIDPTADSVTTVSLFSLDQGVSWFFVASKGGILSGGGSDNLGNHIATQDIDFATFDGKNLDRLLFDQAADTSLLGTDTGITSDAAKNQNYNVPTGAQHIFTENNITPAALVINATTVTSQTLVPAATDDLGLLLVPWNSGYINNIIVGGAGNGMTSIGHLDFVDNLATPAAAISLYSDGTDLFANTGGGVKNLSDIGGGSQTPWLSDIDAALFNLLNFGRIDSNAANLPLTGKIRLGNNEKISWLNTDLVTVASIGLGSSDTLDVVGANLNFLSTNKIINIPNIESAGAMTFDVGGVLYDIKFSGVSEWSFSPSTLGGDNIILNNTLLLNDSSLDPTLDGQFSRNGDVLGLQIPEFSVRNVTTVAAEFASMNIVKVDASPGTDDDIGRLNFQVDDSGVITTYAGVFSEIRNATDAGRLQLVVRADNNSSPVVGIEIEGDDNNLRSYMTVNSRIASNLEFGQESGSTDLKIFPIVNQLGITVQDNLGYTVGANGTIAIPSDDLPETPIPTKAELDTAYGTHEGSTGFDRSTLGDSKLYVRESNGDWSFFTAAGKITV